MGGKLFRGTSKGDIYVSTDGGKTWKLHARFGPACPILDISPNHQGRATVKVGYKSHSFQLALAKDGKRWVLGNSPYLL